MQTKLIKLKPGLGVFYACRSGSGSCLFYSSVSTRRMRIKRYSARLAGVKSDCFVVLGLSGER